MKYIDLAVQTLLILLAIAVLIAGYENNGIGAVLAVQLLIGPWQFLGSAIAIAARAPFRSARRIHLVSATAYLVVLLIAANMDSKIIDIPAALSLPALIIPAWALAVYYYQITWRWVLQKQTRRSSFLPNINF